MNAQILATILAHTHGSPVEELTVHYRPAEDLGDGQMWGDDYRALILSPTERLITTVHVAADGTYLGSTADGCSLRPELWEQMVDGERSSLDAYGFTTAVDLPTGLEADRVWNAFVGGLEVGLAEAKLADASGPEPGADYYRSDSLAQTMRLRRSRARYRAARSHTRPVTEQDAKAFLEVYGMPLMPTS